MVVVVVVRQGGEGLSDEGEGATVLTWAHTQLSQFAWAINAAWVTHVERLGNNYEAFHT